MFDNSADHGNDVTDGANLNRNGGQNCQCYCKKQIDNNFPIEMTSKLCSETTRLGPLVPLAYLLFDRFDVIGYMGSITVQTMEDCCRCFNSVILRLIQFCILFWYVKNANVWSFFFSVLFLVNLHLHQAQEVITLTDTHWTTAHSTNLLMSVESAAKIFVIVSSPFELQYKWS